MSATAEFYNPHTGNYQTFTSGERRESLLFRVPAVTNTPDANFWQYGQVNVNFASNSVYEFDLNSLESRLYSQMMWCLDAIVRKAVIKYNVKAGLSLQLTPAELQNLSANGSGHFLGLTYLNTPASNSSLRYDDIHAKFKVNGQIYTPFLMANVWTRQFQRPQ
jgi:hypothetical protein